MFFYIILYLSANIIANLSNTQINLLAASHQLLLMHKVEDEDEDEIRESVTNFLTNFLKMK